MCSPPSQLLSWWLLQWISWPRPPSSSHPTVTSCSFCLFSREDRDVEGECGWQCALPCSVNMNCTQQTDSFITEESGGKGGGRQDGGIQKGLSEMSKRQRGSEEEEKRKKRGGRNRKQMERGWKKGKCSGWKEWEKEITGRKGGESPGWLKEK